MVLSLDPYFYAKILRYWLIIFRDIDDGQKLVQSNWIRSTSTFLAIIISQFSLFPCRFDLWLEGRLSHCQLSLLWSVKRGSWTPSIKRGHKVYKQSINSIALYHFRVQNTGQQINFSSKTKKNLEGFLGFFSIIIFFSEKFGVVSFWTLNP